MLLSVLTIGLVAGCGDSGSDGEAAKVYDPVFSAIEDLHGKAREQKLLELAREDGNELALYTSLIDKTERAVADGFENRYGIDVSVYRSDSDVLAERVSREAKAGYRGTDVLETNGQELTELNNQGVFVAYTPDALPGLVDDARRDGWTASRINKYVVSWNTDLVPKGEEPRSWEDLADPRWRGKVGLANSHVDWYKTLREYWIREEHKPEAEADRLLEGIARNARVTSSNAVMTDLVAAGELAIGVNYLHLVRDTIDQGAPVAFEPPVAPLITRPNGVGLLKGAEHPAAAVLFEEWLLTDGQEVLRENNLDPARRDLERSGAREYPVDVEDLSESFRDWKDRFEELLRNSKAAGGGG